MSLRLLFSNCFIEAVIYHDLTEVVDYNKCTYH